MTSTHLDIVDRVVEHLPRALLIPLIVEEEQVDAHGHRHLDDDLDTEG